MAKDTEIVNPDARIEDLPEPQISAPPAGQTFDPAKGSGVTLSEVLESPELQEYIKKTVKSQQDTRLGKYGTRLDNLEGAIEKYESLQMQGLSKDQALNQMQGDQELQDVKDQLAQILSGNVTAPSPGGGEASGREQEATILKNEGIAIDDPRVVELLRTQEYSSKDEYLKDLKEKAFGWRQADAKKPQPSATTVAQTIPSIPVGDGTYTAEKYVEDMLAARGKPEEIKRIKAAARADGVDVDNIGFT